MISIPRQVIGEMFYNRDWHECWRSERLPMTVFKVTEEDIMVKCEYCGSDTVEVPDFEDADCYGEFSHVCENCGAVGQEVFGHGISWRKGMFNKINQDNSSMAVQCDAKEKCSLRHTTSCDACKHNRGAKKDKNCYVPR